MRFEVLDIKRSALRTFFRAATLSGTSLSTKANPEFQATSSVLSQRAAHKLQPFSQLFQSSNEKPVSFRHLPLTPQGNSSYLNLLKSSVLRSVFTGTLNTTPRITLFLYQNLQSIKPHRAFSHLPAFRKQQFLQTIHKTHHKDSNLLKVKPVRVSVIFYFSIVEPERI